MAAERLLFIMPMLKGGEKDKVDKSIAKAREISDARIQFVSLVDAAANKRKFLMTKSKDGKTNFVNYGRILKADADTHYVTGVVYEPMTADTDDEFMTEEEIRKAAYWYAKNGDKVDVQHSFDPVENCTVVESWIAKADFNIGTEPVKKGTWLMTIEVEDTDIWSQIEKGNITGLSMGGICVYGKEDIALANEDVTKSDEKKGLLTKMAEALGIKIVEKGAVAEMYSARMANEAFWAAFDSLECILRGYDCRTDTYIYETDETKIKDALNEFNTIITEILSSSEPIAKSIGRPVEKAGKKLSGKNTSTLQGIYDSLGTFLKEMSADDTDGEGDGDTGEEEPDEEPEEKACGTDNASKKKEDSKVTKCEAEEIVKKAVAAAVANGAGPEDEPAATEGTATGTATPEASAEVSKEAIEKMVKEQFEIAKAAQEETQVTADEVQEMITKAIKDIVEPVINSNRIPSNLNGEGQVKKSEEHYLHGIL